jgi:hypothetical protein
MKFFAKAIITGFGLSIGAAIFKKVAKYVGLDDKTQTNVIQADGATDPNLRNQHSHNHTPAH